MATNDFEKSTFQNKPAYRYIRVSDRIPSTEEARAQEDPKVFVKLFNPTGRGTWYIAGYDPETRIAFGAANIFEHEIGDFDVKELVDFRGLMRLPIERDLHFTPVPLSECRGK